MCLQSTGAAWCTVLLLAVARATSAGADAVPDIESGAGVGNEVEWRVRVSAVTPDASAAGGAALARLAAAALAARGVPAQVAAPPAACAAPDAPACRDAMLRALADGALDAAVLPAPATAAPSNPVLRDAGLEQLGDAAPPARRACLVTRGPLRSLLDLADVNRASLYELSPDVLALISRLPCRDSKVCRNETYTPKQCRLDNITCATVLTGDNYELDVMSHVVREYGLYARVLSIGVHLTAAVATLNTRNVIVCDRAPDYTQLARLPASTLGPPPCRAYCDTGRCRHPDPCPFEPRQLLKLANARSLTRSPTALRVLTRLWLDTDELRDLIVHAHLDGPAAAADAYLDAHPQTAPLGEVRTAVLIPANTSREAFDARALVAAAALAEEDLLDEGIPRAAHFKVELSDDGCAAPHAYKYLTDALGTGEYGALSAVAGPACGAAWADAARLSPAHVLPVLAYSLQTAPPPAASLALLAAGDARHLSAAWGAVLAHYGWRRLAVLSEPATRAAFDHATLQTDVIVHIELSENAENQSDLITRWIDRVKSLNARILYVNLEDARAIRAVLCAGRAAGLASGDSGVVWLLPAAPRANWLRVAADDTTSCSAKQLIEAAEGHLSFAPEWLVEWRDGKHKQTTTAASSDLEIWRARWRRRWRARCLSRGARAPGVCAEADPHAALLYDVLRLWAAALDGLLSEQPAALDDLHQPDLVRSLIENATTREYIGLTGLFEWNSESGAHARVSPLILQQWNNGTRRRVARWTRDGLAMEGAVRWRTTDGDAPDDGAEHCTLQPLADALHVDCRTALVALAALLLAAAVGALAGLAVHCRRRAEQEYRARLAALDMRTISLKPGGLDRWEVPRERVVINRKLGTGAFGTVYGGHALLSEERGWTAVAVKTLKAGANTEEKLDFLSEAEAMKRFDHKNIVRLLGVVTKTEPVCTVMEFMLYGDLKNYLLARRHLAGADGGEGAEEVSARRLTSMALDAARALSYLAQLRYVHRDVAARNCLVSAHRQVKLADFGMTRLVFENDYYRFSRKGMLPVRWMAPESLTLGVFSPASDVWSFGVLLYEIVTFGSLPFQGLSNSEVLARVKAGHTLELPPGLKPQLEGLIKSCWQQEHKARPCAAEVAAFLADWPRLLAPCLALPLDALSLDSDNDHTPPWQLPNDITEARWVSWTAPASAGTDTTYLSADGDAPPPRDSDAFLP